MDAKTAFFDGHVRPYLFDQLSPCNNLTCVFEKSDQDVVGPTTKWNGPVSLLERAIREIDFERAESKPGCAWCANFLNRHEFLLPRSLTTRLRLRRQSCSMYTQPPSGLAETPSSGKPSAHRHDRTD